MSDARKIKIILIRQPALEGAGVHLNRVFGYNEAPTFDPFLMLDDFRSDTPEHYLKGFPWHPHRGIETITYVMKGDVEHRQPGQQRYYFFWGCAVDDRRKWNYPPGNA